MSEVKIVTNEQTILYIIDIPETRKTLCKTLIVRPIKQKDEINKIEFKKVLDCKNEIYGTKNCKNHNELTICEQNEIINITNSKCLPRLLQGKEALCIKTNNQHIPEVEEILPGILLFNQYNGTIQINDEKRNIKGSFLISFSNATIRAKDKIFTFNEITTYKPLRAIVQPKAKTEKFEEILTLNLIKELHLNNTKHINLLKTESHISQITFSTIRLRLSITFNSRIRKFMNEFSKISFINFLIRLLNAIDKRSLSAIIVLVIITIVILKVRKQKAKIEITNVTKETKIVTEGATEMITLPSSSSIENIEEAENEMKSEEIIKPKITKRINQIPFF